MQRNDYIFGDIINLRNDKWRHCLKITELRTKPFTFPATRIVTMIVMWLLVTQ